MIRVNGTTITLPVGDTGLLSFKISGGTADSPLVLTSDDRCLFTVTSADGWDVISKTVTPSDNVAAFFFSNADTEALQPGSYMWDFRVVIGAVLNSDAVTGGVEVHSPFAIDKLPKFILKKVAANV